MPNECTETCEIYQVLPYSVHRVRQYLLNVVSFGIKDLYISEMTVNLNSNLYTGTMNISLIFDTAWNVPVHGLAPKGYTVTQDLFCYPS